MFLEENPTRTDHDIAIRNAIRVLTGQGIPFLQIRLQYGNLSATRRSRPELSFQKCVQVVEKEQGVTEDMDSIEFPGHDPIYISRKETSKVDPGGHYLKKLRNFAYCGCSGCRLNAILIVRPTEAASDATK
jgi:hypothetical protein